MNKAQHLTRLALLTGLLGVAATEVWAQGSPIGAVVTGDRVNVRSRPSFRGEVVTQLNIGDRVQVVEQIRLDQPRAEEPADWAKILLPPNTTGWVAAQFVDSNTQTVQASRLNVRAGPDEAFNVLGRFAKGTRLTVVSNQGDWLEVRPPKDSHAYIALNYLDLSAATGMAAPNANPSPIIPTAELPVVVDAGPVLSPAPLELVPVDSFPDPPQISNPQIQPPSHGSREIIPLDQGVGFSSSIPIQSASSTQLNAPQTVTDITAYQTPTLPTPAPTVTLPGRRIVRREGIVAGPLFRARSYFRLKSPENNQTMNYLFSMTPEVNFKNYKGQHIIVTGEEFVDSRWPKIPVLKIERIEGFR